MWWALFLAVLTSACTIDFECPNRMCWRGTCVDPVVRSGVLDINMAQACVRETNLYFNLFYDEACEVQEVIPTEYGVACRCRRVPVQHNTTLHMYQYGPHNVRLWFNDTAICIYTTE